MKLTNKKIKVFFILVLISIFFLSGCSKDNNNPVNAGATQVNTMIINGGPFNNQQVGLVSVGGEHITGSDLSIVLVRSVISTDTIYIGLVFPGTQTGKFTWQNVNDSSATSGCVLTVGYAPSSQNDIYLSDGSAGETDISTYGDVGQTIDGTFGGKIVSLSNVTLNLSGKFSVFRGPDASSGGGVKR